MDLKQIPSFYDKLKSLVPPGFYKGKIIKVYDGDTVWAVINCPASPADTPQDFDKQQLDQIYGDSTNLLKIKIRFAFLNAPELNDTGKKKEVAKKAKELVRNLLLDKEVYFQVFNLGKYFRHICEIYLPANEITDYIDKEYFELIGGVDDLISLNKFMIKSGFAYKKKY